MLKISLLIILVICSHSILSICGADDEFAEFDDFVPEETNQDSLGPKTKDQNKKQPVVIKVNLDETVNKAGSSKSKDKLLDDDVKSEEKTKKKPDLMLVNAPSPRMYQWESYYFEIIFLFASVLYFLNYFIGNGKNHKFAQDWYEPSRELLKQQFALVGGSPQLNDGAQKKDDDAELTTIKKQKGLIKTTQSMYTLWCSGRVGLDGMLVEINLLKRQDLFSMALNLLKPKTDSMIFRFLLNQDGYENFVFCLAHKTLALKMARDLIDINTFCPKRKPISQYGIDSERLFVMSELSDVCSFILDQRTVSFIKKYEQSIKFIHITDQYSTVRSEELIAAQKLANSKRMATFSFNFPQKAEDRVEFILFALSLLDRLRRFKLARDSKQKSEKNRQKINDIIQKTAFSQRQEAAQNKKEELRRLEKERVYNEDNPEKQRLWEKKEAKRDSKKNKMRVKKLKVKSQ